MKKRIIVIGFILIVISTSVFARKTFTISTDYNIPISNETVDQNLSFGADYRFWGIFQFIGNMYTSVVYGGDNILNIKRIEPLGLFSFGIGIKIPLGGFYLALDYEKFYTGTTAKTGIYDFCDSVKAGINIDLSSTFGFEFYNRRLFNFSEKAVSDGGYRISKSDGIIWLLGVGVNFHIF
ncbi:MAG: hypothetical protein GXP33_04550 [Spirochaetes bacterium]|nr:hypothetical protein [Spirochaetota bacterium]